MAETHTHFTLHKVTSLKCKNGSEYGTFSHLIWLKHEHIINLDMGAVKFHDINMPFSQFSKHQHAPNTLKSAAHINMSCFRL
jgi:hypothetical protein